jgi:serine/threonine protein kinase
MQIEVLGERYQIQDPIGRGGMATIYRGRDMRMDRIVAIKMLREVYSTDPKFVTRFQREAKAASSLQHPNIVQVYDYGQSAGNYFIVMEYIEGTDLRRYLRSRGVLAVDRAVIIAHDVALGLGAAHRRQIVHRDVKPQNILVGRDGSIKLTDFGIASVYKDINDERLTTTGMTLGTVQYYAPEQAQGEIVNPAADVYALGIVMYEMLAGRTPFDGDTPVAVAMQHIQDIPTPLSQLNPNIPPALENIIMRCLEKIPEMRYRDGSSLARALELLGEGNGGGATPPLASSGSSSIPESNDNGSAGVVKNLSGGMSNSSPNNGITSPPNNRSGGQYSPANNGGSPAQGVGAAVGADVAHGSQASGYAQSSASDATISMNQQADPYKTPDTGDAGTTRPFRKGDIGTGGKPAESRAISVVTILILFATLLLLGFSIYLAGELGFISLPGAESSSVTPTPQQVTVPNLVGLSYMQAKQAAEAKGFKFQSTDNVTQGKVKQQSPQASQTALYGSMITVQLEKTQNTQSGVKIPNLIGLSVTQARQMLKEAGIQAIQVLPDPNNPNDPNKGTNIVTLTDPLAGEMLPPGKTITLYITNDTKDAPTAQPIQQNTPVVNPTLAPPTPTPAPPTPTPTPTPAPPTPTPTPTTGVTPISTP